MIYISAALLSILLVSAVLLDTNTEVPSGYSIGGMDISILGYTDDIIAMNDSIAELQLYLDALTENSRNVGLTININKTKCMLTDKECTPLTIAIQSRDLDEINHFDDVGFGRWKK